jgi:hypothetical protein
MWTGSRLEPESRSERISIRMTPEELRLIERHPGTRSDVLRKLVSAGLDALAAKDRAGA